jgi:CHASE1-domain containing sensor protein
MILIIAVLGMLIWYLRYKTEKIEQRIEFEMTAIRNERDNEIDSSRTDIVRH